MKIICEIRERKSKLRVLLSTPNLKYLALMQALNLSYLKQVTTMPVAPNRKGTQPAIDRLPNADCQRRTHNPHWQAHPFETSLLNTGSLSASVLTT